MKWSEEVWSEAEHIYRSILELPFVRELSEGTLSRERFIYYIGQDSLYIENYSRVLAHIASRLTRRDHVEEFLKFASDGIMVERLLHESFLDGTVPYIDPAPTTLLYTSFESSMALRPVEVEAASILPCFGVYQKVGEDILARSREDNPYSRWIATYADESFAAATRRATEICDELAEDATPAVRQQMTRAFITSTKMEWMFWDSAYNLEKWKI